MTMRRDGERLLLDGPVTLATHTALREQAETLLGSDAIRVDWSAVEAVDSSALSLILHWQRAAAARGQRAVQDNLPAGVLALAELYGVREFL